MCASLHPPDHRCEHPEQCDYEVKYADGGSSLGVLVKDFFPLNFTNGFQLVPRLALGLVTSLLSLSELFVMELQSSLSLNCGFLDPTPTNNCFK